MKPVCSPEDMFADIMEAGLIPFFANHIPGYSIEDLTPRDYWFDGDELGPWDWKIFAVQSGRVAYGKFLLGGKAAFASEECYRHLMNWRRNASPAPMKKGKVKGGGNKAKAVEEEGMAGCIMDFVRKNGSCSTADVRRLLGIRKAAADNLVARLQHRTLLVIGDFERVYRGADLHYSGWQRATFCRPEDLFGDPSDAPVPGPFAAFESFASDVAEAEDTGGPGDCTPQESYSFLVSRIRSLAPSATDSDIARILA